MSKKTILFKMPEKTKPRPEAVEGERLPAAHSAGKAQISLPARRDSERGIAAEPDQWVQHRDIEIETEARPVRLATQPLVPSARKLSIDISAERDLHEAVALAILVPPMLGWFWVFNVVNRYWGHFG